MRHEEHHIQCAIADYLRANKVFFWATPNGDKRDARTGARLKREGVLAGVSDITILNGGDTYYIEVKTPKGRQTESQKEFQRQVEARGHCYMIWRSIDDAIKWAKYLI